MKVTVARESMALVLRWAQRGLFALAFVTLGYCGFMFADSWIFERRANLELDRLLRQSQSQGTQVSVSRRKVAPGGLIGRIDVDRLGVSVAVVEGPMKPPCIAPPDTLPEPRCRARSATWESPRTGIPFSAHCGISGQTTLFA